MRVKIESVAPLPHVKAWFTVNALSTVHDLKTSLSADLLALRDAGVHAHDLLLLLDDFELLDFSSIDVIRDGDLLILKKAPNKRKAAAQEASSPARKRLKKNDGGARSIPPQTRAPSNHHPPSSSDSDSDSSSSDSSGSSESESESESDSSTSSDSSSSSASSVHAPRRKSPKTGASVPQGPVKNTGPASKSSPDAPPVPPGQGKPSTHSRNLRRRRKKLYERIALTAEPASVNEIPLGARARTLEPPAAAPSPSSSSTSSSASSSSPSELEARQPKPTPVPAKKADDSRKRKAPEEGPAQPFMMASLSNKNKRRGFKDALARGVPAKITFADADATAESGPLSTGGPAIPDAAPAAAAVTHAQRTQGAHARLVPPSEKQARGQLPANLFVTSVDVEEGLWPSRKNPKKQKKQKRQQPPAEEDGTWDAPFAHGLPYDDESAQTARRTPDAAHGNGSGSGSGTGVQAAERRRAAVAAAWDSLRKITERAQVSEGATVAWKALGINYATLTPEMLLHVARVRQCGERLVVQVELGAEAGGVAFGGVGGEAGAEAEEQSLVEEEVCEWADVFQGDWRLVVSAPE